MDADAPLRRRQPDAKRHGDGRRRDTEGRHSEGGDTEEVDSDNADPDRAASEVASLTPFFPAPRVGRKGPRVRRGLDRTAPGSAQPLVNLRNDSVREGRGILVTERRPEKRGLPPRHVLSRDEIRELLSPLRTESPEDRPPVLVLTDRPEDAESVAKTLKRCDLSHVSASHRFAALDWFRQRRYSAVVASTRTLLIEAQGFVERLREVDPKIAIYLICDVDEDPLIQGVELVRRPLTDLSLRDLARDLAPESPVGGVDDTEDPASLPAAPSGGESSGADWPPSPAPEKPFRGAELPSPVLPSPASSASEPPASERSPSPQPASQRPPSERPASIESPASLPSPTPRPVSTRPPIHEGAGHGAGGDFGRDDLGYSDPPTDRERERQERYDNTFVPGPGRRRDDVSRANPQVRVSPNDLLLHVPDPFSCIQCVTEARLAGGDLEAGLRRWVHEDNHVSGLAILSMETPSELESAGTVGLGSSGYSCRAIATTVEAREEIQRVVSVHLGESIFEDESSLTIAGQFFVFCEPGRPRTRWAVFAPGILEAPEAAQRVVDGIVRCLPQLRRIQSEQAPRSVESVPEFEDTVDAVTPNRLQAVLDRLDDLERRFPKS